MVTLSDVAALAGVSKATASRALSQPQLLAPETLARVVSAAQSLGFKANRAARALASGSTGLVSVVVPTLENAFFSPVIQGAQRAASAGELQASVTVLPASSPAEQQQLLRLADQVDGFVLASPQAPASFLKTLARHKPLVTLDRRVPGLPSVIGDTPAALSELVAGLVAAGHRRIAYVGGPEGSWMDRRRSAAAQAAAGGSCAVDTIGPLPPTFTSGVQAAHAIHGSGATAVIVYASVISLGLVFELSRLGVSVPGDLTLASADDLAIGPLPELGLISLKVDADRLGESAMELLLGQIKGEIAAPQHRRIEVPVHWAAESHGSAPDHRRN